MSRTSADEYAGVLGTHIRELRRAQGLTLVEVSRLSGLSHPFLSQVENGKARASFASLDRIARALGTTQFDLFADVARSGEGAAPGAGEPSDSGTTLSPFADGSARVFLGKPTSFTPVEVSADTTEFGEYFLHPEEEFCYLLEGTAQLDLDGQVRTLVPGTTAYYPGGTPHRWRSVDGRPFRILFVKARRETEEER